MFIAIEGVDFTGKSTLVSTLTSKLKAEGKTVHNTRSPGGTPDADIVRSVMLEPHQNRDIRLLLSSATRLMSTQFICEEWNTQEETNPIVITDRWLLSGWAYQVVGEGSSPKTFLDINSNVAIPQFTVVLRLTEEAYNRRKISTADKDLDVMEESLKDKDFFDRVNDSILNDQPYPSTYLYVDVDNQTPEELADEVWSLICSTSNADLFPELNN